MDNSLPVPPFTFRTEPQARVAPWLDSALSHAPWGMLLLDADLNVRFMNPTAEAMTGFAQADMLGQSFFSLNPVSGEEYYQQNVLPVFAWCDRWEGQVWRARKQGEVYQEQQKIVQITDTDTGDVGYWVYLRDISEQSYQRQRIQALTYFDPLTGLPNKANLQRYAQSTLPLWCEQQRQPVLALLDLENFKRINDSLSREHGDALLQQVAERLQAMLPTESVLARLDADSFLLLLPATDDQQLTQLLERVMQPYHLSPHQVCVRAHMGAVNLDTETVFETALEQTHIALAHARQRRDQGVAYFHPSMQQQVAIKAKLEHELMTAIEQQQLRVVYQPKVAVSTGRVVGAEALVRWQHPRQGLLTPGHFIELAEQSGWVVNLDHWVLAKVYQDVFTWQAHGFVDLSVAVNVSAQHFQQADSILRLQQQVKRSPLIPGALELEITERAIMDDVSRTTEALAALKSLGVKLSVDDFGTGYSSLAYLRRFPIDVLKIDRSFIKDLEHDNEAQVIAKTIIALGHALSLQVVAEGVEKPEQFAILQEQGCDQVQGYWLSRPLSAQDFLSVLRTPSLLSALQRKVSLSA